MTVAAFDEARCLGACEHVARRIVRPLVLKFRREPLAADTKPDKSLVTEADRQIERQVRAYLKSEFPGYGLAGEEFGAEDSDAEYVWTIDPIDGTEAFVAGIPLFGSLLALIRQKDGRRLPILGSMYLPLDDILLLGNRKITTVNGRPERMPNAAAAADRCVLLGDLAQIVRRVPPGRRERIFALAGRHRAAQTWEGCRGLLAMLDGYAQAQLAAGQGIEDIAPLEPLVFGAGGCVTDLDGRSLADVLSDLRDLGDDSADFSSLVAVDRQVHGDVLRSLCGPSASGG